MKIYFSLIYYLKLKYFLFWLFLKLEEILKNYCMNHLYFLINNHIYFINYFILKLIH